MFRQIRGRGTEPSASAAATASFSGERAARRYWVILAVLAVLAVGFTAGLLAWGNPLPFGTDGFWLIARRRADAIIAMMIVACAQAIATVAFQSIANNRIITPSIMGFEALYVAISTSAVYFFGVTGLAQAGSLGAFVFQLALMIGLSLVLYTWLLTGRGADMQSMLLVGIVIGGGLASLSTFMQRLLTPSEFDLLTARLFGSVNNADPEFFPVAVPLVLVAAGVILARSRVLNVMALGREVSTGLGVNYQRSSILILVCVAVLMAVSTAMVGPMTFLGFLVATIAYQAADTFDHRFVLPMAALIGYVTLAGAYFVLNHVFYTQGVVSIIIELVGGSIFLYVVLKKGRL
nr:iron chelate uptake ABC transporter family permease subunit [Corynebacterium lactis]